MATISAGQLMEYAEKRALQAALGAAVALSGTAANLALATNAATGSMDNTFLTMASVAEYAATGYARQGFTAGTPTSASPSVIANTNVITFGPTTSSPGTTINWGVLCDAVSGTAANCEVAFLVTTPRTPVSGDSIQAAAGSFTAQV